MDDLNEIGMEDLRRWSDDDLQLEYDQRLVDAADITRQINDDIEEGQIRPESWRIKARAARRVYRRFADKLDQEMQRRNTAKNANHVQSLAEVLEKNKKLREKLQSIHAERNAHHDANMHQCQMFVKAAYRVFSRDDCDRVWARAFRMFPDSVAWTEEQRNAYMRDDDEVPA